MCPLKKVVKSAILLHPSMHKRLRGTNTTCKQFTLQYSHIVIILFVRKSFSFEFFFRFVAVTGAGAGTGAAATQMGRPGAVNKGSWLGHTGQKRLDMS